MSDQAKFVLGVDLDGVCADFYGAMRPIAQEWLGEPELTADVSYGLGEWNLARAGTYDDLHRFAVVQRALFEKAEPIEGSAAALRRIAQLQVRIRIVTHRLFIKHFHQQAVAQTVAWLDNHGFPYWDICFMKDKAAVGADLYIEDSPKNVEALRAANHDVIVYTNSTNGNVAAPRADDWHEVERMVRERVTAWQPRNSDRPIAGT
jgi:5'(3')-deoxyribonucleotidase